MSIFKILAKLSPDFKVVASPKSHETMLKENAESSTLKEKNLESKIKQDAIKKAAASGYHMPARSDPEYDRKLKQHHEHVDFHTAHHYKIPDLIKYGREAAKHRLAYTKFMRSKTTAASKPKVGTFQYHADNALQLVTKIEKDAREASGFTDKDENSNYKSDNATKRRVVNYVNAKKNHPDAAEAKKHLELMNKLHKTTASDSPPEPANPELYARCKTAAKKKFDVYPSWVSSQWVVKRYKKLGGKFK